MRENLVPATITDKRGRTTTVYRNPSIHNATIAKLPAVTMPKIADSREKYRAINESVRQAQEQRRLEKELLEAGAEEKEEIIGRLVKLYEKEGLDKAEDFRSRRDTHYLEGWSAMERLVSLEPVNKEFMTKVGGLHRSTTGDTFRDWTQLAERHYGALLDSPMGDPRAPQIITGIISACLSETKERKHRTGEALTETQERNFLFLNVAVFGSRLEGKHVYEGGGYGVMTSLDNPDLIDFALTCTDEQRLHRVCEAIRSTGRGTGVTRFTEALAIADGDTSAPLANGAL